MPMGGPRTYYSRGAMYKSAPKTARTMIGVGSRRRPRSAQQALSRGAGGRADQSYESGGGAGETFENGAAGRRAPGGTMLAIGEIMSMGAPRRRTGSGLSSLTGVRSGGDDNDGANDASAFSDVDPSSRLADSSGYSEIRRTKTALADSSADFDLDRSGPQEEAAPYVVQLPGEYYPHYSRREHGELTAMKRAVRRGGKNTFFSNATSIRPSSAPATRKVDLLHRKNVTYEGLVNDYLVRPTSASRERGRGGGRPPASRPGTAPSSRTRTPSRGTGGGPGRVATPGSALEHRERENRERLEREQIANREQRESRERDHREQS